MLVSIPHSSSPRSEYLDDTIRVSADGSAPRVRWLARADQDRESAAGCGIASTEVCGDTGVTLSDTLEPALSLERRTMAAHAPTDAMDAMVATSATDATTAPRPCGGSPPPRPCGGGSGGSAGGGGSDVGDGGGSGGGGAVTMGTTARLMEIGAADVTATPRLAVMALAGLATSAMADVLTAAAVVSAAAAESGMVRTAVIRREPAGTCSTIRHSGS